MLKTPFLNKYQNLISEINALEDKLKIFTDSELRNRNLQLKKQYKKTPNLDSLIIESFALTREASLRTLGLRHFNVQLIGGLVLNNQQIAEMKTGEGKTLVATLPASLNALTEKSVHILTVNDYLASRDQVSMSQIYKFLGLDTGVIQENMTNYERKKNYKADITYLTNSEVAFDFLRDNLVLNLNDIVLRPFHYCIIDEVDSVLIDEAQTPLLISAANKKANIEKYICAEEIITYLELNGDYKIDEKNKNVSLTEKGNQRIEKILSIQNLYSTKEPWPTYILNALKAQVLYFKNVHYLIQNNRIIMVDEFTGRIMPDRRWSDGLHQAIEAKEKLPIGQRTNTIAAITYQNFFLLYSKLAGMTGTGKTAEIEFEKIYNLSVTEIPTASPTQRKDLPDMIYKDQFSKWNAIVEDCYKTSLKGQPILVGTTTIEKSEILAQLLNEYKLSYHLLNAKPENARYEAKIVAQAGKKNTITIATNMAGRGTDIILGGNINFQIQTELYDTLILIKKKLLKPKILKASFLSKLNGSSQKFLSILLSLIQDQKFLNLSNLEILRILQKSDRLSIPINSYQCAIKFLINELILYSKKHQKQNNKIVQKLGGLYIIGTERNDSRRIDNQLRGRCGRQGDPGISKFFLSLDDNLLRLFGSLKVQNLLDTDDLPLKSKWITKSLESAQLQVEERAYQQRKNLFDYDDILNKQRSLFYNERLQLLKSLGSKDFGSKEKILSYYEQVVTEILVKQEKQILTISKKETISSIESLLGRNVILNNLQDSDSYIDNLNLYELKIYLFQEFWLLYHSKFIYAKKLRRRVMRYTEGGLLLLVMDQIWSEYLYSLTSLRNLIGWRGYGQKNPLFEYNSEAFKLFNKYRELFKYLMLHNLVRLYIT